MAGVAEAKGLRLSFPGPLLGAPGPSCVPVSRESLPGQQRLGSEIKQMEALRSLGPPPPRPRALGLTYKALLFD